MCTESVYYKRLHLKAYSVFSESIKIDVFTKSTECLTNELGW